MAAEQFARTELLLGKAAMEKLAGSRVAVFGIGGVGGYVCEALARSGIGAFELVDSDRVSLTNLNRQIIATRKTIGQYKAEVMKERILEINPEAEVRVRNCFFLPENAEEFDFQEYDYVVDAVDTVTAKIALVMKAEEGGVPIISSMGAGNKLDGSRFRVADIYDTKVCPLAKVMRRELKKRGVERLKVVYSEEEPVCPRKWAQEPDHGCPPDNALPEESDFQGANRKYAIGYEEKKGVGKGSAEPFGQEKMQDEPVKRPVPGSVAFVPSVAGLIIAGEVVKDLCV